MSYCVSGQNREALFAKLAEKYDVYAPKVFEGDGCFSDTDVVRYDKITSFDEIEWKKKSDYSWKEVLLPINETLFYFTESTTTVPEPEKGKLIFLRSCDLHSVKRVDEIYLRNGAEDFYYKRRRDDVKFVLMGCSETCDTGFCVSMGTNQSNDYDLYMKDTDQGLLVKCQDETLETVIKQVESAETEVSVDYVAENKEKVHLPKNLSNESFDDEIWEEYGSRCINCGRCNFACPTCTCFTMQDMFYQDNAKVGERRRVWASCQVDGYTDMAGGIQFRKSNADRTRFKVMHKIYDFEKRFGYPMCVGCGRCDAICPEYISFSNLVNKLAKKEGK